MKYEQTAPNNYSCFDYLNYKLIIVLSNLKISVLNHILGLLNYLQSHNHLYFYIRIFTCQVQLLLKTSFKRYDVNSVIIIILNFHYQQVPETIEKFRQAGIRVWVLTGDKMETAVNIGNDENNFNKDLLCPNQRGAIILICCIYNIYAAIFVSLPYLNYSN